MSNLVDRVYLLEHWCCLYIYRYIILNQLSDQITLSKWKELNNFLLEMLKKERKIAMSGISLFQIYCCRKFESKTKTCSRRNKPHRHTHSHYRHSYDKNIHISISIKRLSGEKRWTLNWMLLCKPQWGQHACLTDSKQLPST